MAGTNPFAISQQQGLPFSVEQLGSVSPSNFAPALSAPKPLAPFATADQMANIGRDLFL